MSESDAEHLRSIAARVKNWDRWGSEDEKGTLNYVTPAAVVRAAQLVRRGETYSLALPFEQDGPMTGRGGRFNPIHSMIATGTDTVSQGVESGYADDIVIMPLQCGTQWDALAHFFHEGVMYGGRSAALVSSAGAHRNGIERVTMRFATRGLLLDVARHRRVHSLAPGDRIEADELEAVAHDSGVYPEAGDALLIRTGFLAACRTAGDWLGYTEGDSPGLALSTVEWLHANKVSMVASDTRRVEVAPSEIAGCPAPFHVLTIVYMGLALGEMFSLEELATACDRHRDYRFLFVAPPLAIVGAVGAPVNPYALR